MYIQNIASAFEADQIDSLNLLAAIVGQFNFTPLMLSCLARLNWFCEPEHQINGAGRVQSRLVGACLLLAYCSH